MTAYDLPGKISSDLETDLKNSISQSLSNLQFSIFANIVCFYKFKTFFLGCTSVLKNILWKVFFITESS